MKRIKASDDFNKHSSMYVERIKWLDSSSTPLKGDAEEGKDKIKYLHHDDDGIHVWYSVIDSNGNSKDKKVKISEWDKLNAEEGKEECQHRVGGDGEGNAICTKCFVPLHLVKQDKK